MPVASVQGKCRHPAGRLSIAHNLTRLVDPGRRADVAAERAEILDAAALCPKEGMSNRAIEVEVPHDITLIVDEGGNHVLS